MYVNVVNFPVIKMVTPLQELFTRILGMSVDYVGKFNTYAPVYFK